MKRILPFLFLLLGCSYWLAAQETAPNKTDKDGRKKGKWIFSFYEENAPAENRSDYLTSYYIARFKKGVPVGLTREYDKTCRLIWEGHLTHILPDTLNGISRYFNDNGSVAAEYPMVQNRVQGMARKYYPSGALQWECNYTADYPDGVYTEYYEDGALMRTGTVTMGQKNGSFLFYYPDGTPEKELLYANDIYQGPFTEYYASGAVARTGTYKDGKLHGLYMKIDSASRDTSFYIYLEGENQQLATFIQDISFSLALMMLEEGLEKAKILEAYFRLAYGTDSPVYPFAVSTLAQFYFMLGDDVNGLEWVMKSYELELQQLGTDQSASADQWQLLSLMLKAYDRQEEATEAMDAAVTASLEEGLPTEQTIEMLARSAEMHLALDRSKEGMAQFEKARNWCNAMDSTSDAICVQTMLDYVLYLQADFRYRDAATLLASIQEKALRSGAAAAWTYSFAETAMSLNQTELALQSYQQVYEQPVDTLDGGYWKKKAAAALARYHTDAGNIATAERLWLEAAQLAATGTDSADYYSMLDDLAGFYAKVGRYEKAIAYATRVSEYYFREVADTSSAIDNLINADLKLETALNGALTMGSYLEYAGRYEEAGTIYNELLNAAQDVYPDTSLMYAILLEAKAGYELYAGNYPLAEQLYEKALSISDTYYPNNNINYTTWKDNLSELYIRMGRYDEALELAEEVYDERTSDLLATDPLIGVSMSRMSKIWEELGDVYKAQTLYGSYLQRQMDYLNNAFSVMNMAEQEAFLRTFRFSFDIYSAMVASFGKEGGGYQQLLDFQMNNRALLLYSSTAARRKFEQHPDSRIREQYAYWLQINQQRIALQSDPATAAEADSLQEVADSIEKELNLLAGEAINYVPVLSTDSIQQQLTDDEVLVHFIRYPEFRQDTIYMWWYAAIVLDHASAFPEMVTLTDEPNLAALLHRNATEVTDKDYIDRLYTWPELEEDSLYFQGDRLFAVTWKPLMHLLEGKSRIFFSAAGMLQQLNLGAVPLGPDAYMAFAFDVYDLATAAHLTAAKRGIYFDDAPVLELFGGVDYTASDKDLKAQLPAGDTPVADVFAWETDSLQTRGGDWKYLPGTRAEVKAILQLAEKKGGKGAVYTGAAASEDLLKQTTGSTAPDILHFATHGFFGNSSDRYAGTNPLFESGLLLAGGGRSWAGDRPSGLNDGILTAAEVSFLNLSRTRLVVLSACETGLGIIDANEGVFGLQRAFNLAGVENMLMSMWKISDRETALFMQTFYGYLFDGADVHTAFRQTQRDMSQQLGPYYWAAFVLQQ